MQKKKRFEQKCHKKNKWAPGSKLERTLGMRLHGLSNLLWSESRGVGGGPLMAYTERLHPKGTFFRLQVYEKVGISIWKGRELCHFIL